MSTDASTPKACAFCGATGSLTREHIFGDWLSRSGLDAGSVCHRTGWLNQMGAEQGLGPMFSRTVRRFCADCNNGWMSQLEEATRQILGPLLLGEDGVIPVEDQAVIALWAHKTALVAMLASSDADRAEGYGLNPAEYQRFHLAQAEGQPTSASWWWIGRYAGTERQAVAWVTPVVVELEELPDPLSPHGYAMTIAVGAVLIHGVQFTALGMNLELATRHQMARLWPSDEAVQWPQGSPVGDDDFLPFVRAGDLRTRHKRIGVGPWRPAVDLPPSELVGDTVELPAVCGQHTLRYPAALAQAAMHGHLSAFIGSCDCGHWYLVFLETDHARCHAAGTADYVRGKYNELHGEERRIAHLGKPFEFRAFELT